MNKIAFNTSMMTDQPTGVGIYSLHLLDKIKKQKSKPDFDIYSIGKLHPKMLSLYRLGWNIFILPFLVKRNQLVFSFSSHGSPFIKNQIITIHDLISLNFPKQHRVQYLYFKYILPLILNSCIKIVAISEFTKSEIIKYYRIPEQKIVVIKNGANLAGEESSLKAKAELMQLTGGKPYFICVGAAYSHKNIHRLIEAIKLVQTDHLFVIVGKNNDYFETVRQKVKELQSGNVLLLDYISAPLLSALYKYAACNLYISLYEGFGFPPLEAASLNTVSLVSEIPALKEIYGDSVIYTDPYSINDIAKKLTMIVEGKIDFSPVKQKFPALLSKYTWEKTAAETMDLIHENCSACTI